MFTYLNEKLFYLIQFFYNYINEFIRELHTDFNYSTYFILISLAFIYGILHSIGPGHGKTIIATYFFKDNNKISKSLILSVIVSFTHTSSAIILSFLLSYVFTGVQRFFQIKLQYYFTFASGLMIIIIALIFLCLKLLNCLKKRRKHIEFKKNLILTGISAGMVPCPVSLMVMLFAISNNIILIGLSVVLSISLGMYVLLSIIGFLSIKSRNKLLEISNKKMKKSEYFAESIEIISVIIMFLIGFSMTFNTYTMVFK
jgi:ABC-type nickel/cobalt efflux system permease component RcnA